MGLFNNTTEYKPSSKQAQSGANLSSVGNPSVSNANKQSKQKKNLSTYITWVVVLFAFVYSFFIQIVQKYIYEQNVSTSVQEVELKNFAVDMQNSIQEKVRQDLADQGINISN